MIPKKCSQIQEMISAYQDSELPLESKNFVRRHTAQCKECAKQLQDYQKVWELLGEWDEINIKPDYLKNFYEKLKNRL